jgi:hypothetical protein
MCVFLSFWGYRKTLFRDPFILNYKKIINVDLKIIKNKLKDIKC